MSRLMLATSNPGKVFEFQALLGEWRSLRGIEIVTPRDWPDPLPDVLETGTTFSENARLKAVALAQATNFPALADDSGLCVDALGGQPGIFSARWAGETATDADRNALLLSRLDGIAAEKRTAQYVCAVSLALPDGRSLEAAGTCDGLILNRPIGSSGFGYDPLFLMPKLGQTMAQLDMSQKNRISHRAAALSALSELLRAGHFYSFV